MFDVAGELARVEQELGDSDKQVRRLEGLLGSDFSRKAPPETVERERERLAEQRERQETLQRRRATLSRLASVDAPVNSIDTPLAQTNPKTVRPRVNAPA